MTVTEMSASPGNGRYRQPPLFSPFSLWVLTMSLTARSSFGRSAGERVCP